MEPHTIDRSSDDGADHDCRALLARLEQLEDRLSVYEGGTRRHVDARVDRVVQSLGVIVEFLENRHLITKDDLKTYVEGNFRIEDGTSGDERFRGLIDVYDWLVWSEWRRGRRSGAVRAPKLAQDAQCGLRARDR